MHRRRFLAETLAAPALPLSFSFAFARNRDLTIVSWGGAYQDAQREVFFRPFQQATRQRLLEEIREEGLEALRRRLAAGTTTWDLVQVEGEELLIGAEEGLFEPLHWPAIGGREAYLPQAVHEYGVGTILYAFVIAYDRDRLTVGPRNWAEFFDTRRFPSKRALRRGPKITLEIALMADGLSPDAIYATLATDRGTQRAFRKLDGIRADVVWWEHAAQPPQWLAEGEVVLTLACNGRIALANTAEKRNFAIVWTNNLYTLDSWAIVKGSPNRGRAHAFLRFAGQAEVQAALPLRIPYGVTARGANERLPPDLLAQLPTAPHHLVQALQIDDRFWRAHRARLTHHFEAWLAR